MVRAKVTVPPLAVPPKTYYSSLGSSASAVITRNPPAKNASFPRADCRSLKAAPVRLNTTGVGLGLPRRWTGTMTEPYWGALPM